MFLNQNISNIRFNVFACSILVLVCIFGCSRNYDVRINESEDVEEAKTLEDLLTVTPEKAALHSDYQIMERIAVPYVPEYRIGPGDIIEIVYHIRYEKTPEDYRLEVQDKVSIYFPFHPQFSTTALVRTDGKITVPILGDVEAESKTPQEVADYLNNHYSAYLNNPSITVALERFNVKIEELKLAITTAPRGQSKIAPVAPDGRISFPIIGALQAQGFTRSQLEKTVNEKYSAYVRNLRVNLILLEIKNSKFYVLGEVGMPGSYPMPSRMTLLDALATARVDTKRANFRDIVIIRNDALERPVAYRVNVSRALRGHAANNIYLRPADIVYVPKDTLTNLNDLIEKVFVKGAWSIMPFMTDFSWGEKDLGGDGGYQGD